MAFDKWQIVLFTHFGSQKRKILKLKRKIERLGSSHCAWKGGSKRRKTHFSELKFSTVAWVTSRITTRNTKWHPFRRSEPNKIENVIKLWKLTCFYHHFGSRIFVFQFFLAFDRVTVQVITFWIRAYFQLS